MTTTPSHQPRPVLGWQSMYPEMDPDRSVQEYADMAARGIELGQVNIMMDQVFHHREAMDADSPECWAKYDRLVEGAAKNFPWICFRIHLGYAAKVIVRLAREKGKTPIFDFPDIMQDQWGRRACLQYHEGPGSFALPDVRARYLEFVGRVVRRYGHLAHRIRWVSVTFSNAQESEFPHGNHPFKEDGWPGEGDWPTRFDYHPANIPGFRSFVAEKYKTLQELNAEWGSSYGDWAQVDAPRIALPDITPSCFEDWRLLFKTPAGVDWYRYNYSVLKGFLLDCRASIRKTRDDIPFCTEFGSCTDQLGLLRGNYDYPDVNSWVDVFKTGQAGRNWGGERMIDADLCRPNFHCARHMEVNENDVATQSHPPITDPAKVKHEMLEMGRWVFRQGVECVILIGSSKSKYYSGTREVAEELRKFVSSPYEPVQVVGTVNVTVDDLITNYQGVWQRWHEASKGLDWQQRIDVKVHP